MGFIGAIGSIATLVFIIKCGRRAVDGIEDKKCWAYLLVSMLAMSVGLSWPDMYMGIGMFFLLAWWAYLANWLYKLIAHKVAKREKATKKDFWMPIACFALMIVAVAIAPKKEADSSSVAASSFVEKKSDSQAVIEESKQAEQEAERNAALKAESERRAAEAAASSKKEEPASREQSASEKAKEEERNAAIRAESEKQAASSKSSSKPKKSSSSTSERTVTTIDFNAVYKEYKSNEVRAEETYGDKRYRVTGTVNALTDSGLANLFGGTTVTLVRQVGNTTVYFFASFSKDQKDAIMKINTGDEITFVGEYSKMSFYSCELESYTRDGKTVKIY